MDLGLKNKVALIAASSRGLGRAVAWSLAREGAKLVICARNKKVLEKTADDILMETGVTVFPLAIDLGDPDRIDWLTNETMDLFGRIDILVTNAGGPPAGSFESLNETDWKKSVDTTLMSVVRLSRSVIPAKKKNKWGRIIHMTSASAKQPIPGLLLSNTLRPAVLGLMKSMAQELAQDRITVNAVCPGYFITDRVKDLMRHEAAQAGKKPEDIEKELVRQIPAGRLGDPEEFGDLVTFLASEKAAYITGSALTIDGGYVKGLI